MAEQGAICDTFANIMKMQSGTDPTGGKLWEERSNYSGSIIRRAAELEGVAIDDESAIDDLLNRYSMWLLNQFSNPDDATIMDNDGRVAATGMVSDVCVALFETADDAILAKHPELVGTTQSNEILVRDLDTANHQNEDLITENAELHQLLEAAEADLQEALDELVLVEAVAANAETAIADREAIAGKVATLERQLGAANAVVENITALKTEIATLRRDNSRLQADRDRLDSELDAAVLALLAPDSANDLADDLADDTVAASAENADAVTPEVVVESNPKTHQQASDLPNIDPPNIDLPRVDLTSVDLFPESPLAGLPSPASSDDSTPTADTMQSADIPVSAASTRASDISKPTSLLPANETAQADKRLFMAQLGAFRQRMHAEAQIKLLFDTFTEDLATAELTIAESKLPGGSDVFRVLTNGMSAPAAARICDALWQRMVGCMLKAVP
jgi:regulator of replication initiation timing